MKTTPLFFAILLCFVVISIALPAHAMIESTQQPNCDTIYTTDNKILIVEISALTDNDITYNDCNGSGDKKVIRNKYVRHIQSTRYTFLTKKQIKEKDTNPIGKRSLIMGIMGFFLIFFTILLIPAMFGGSFLSVFLLIVTPVTGLILSILAILKGKKVDKISRKGRLGKRWGIATLALIFVIAALIGTAFILF